MEKHVAEGSKGGFIVRTADENPNGFTLVCKVVLHICAVMTSYTYVPTVHSVAIG